MQISLAGCCPASLSVEGPSASNMHINSPACMVTAALQLQRTILNCTDHTCQAGNTLCYIFHQSCLTGCLRISSTTDAGRPDTSWSYRKWKPAQRAADKALQSSTGKTSTMLLKLNYNISCLKLNVDDCWILHTFWICRKPLLSHHAPPGRNTQGFCSMRAPSTANCNACCYASSSMQLPNIYPHSTPACRLSSASYCKSRHFKDCCTHLAPPAPHTAAGCR
jgi:hypothetical protein